MLDRDAQLLERFKRLYGLDLRARGNEIARAAFETENRRLHGEGRIMHFGSPIGSEVEHGMRERYPHTFADGSDQHLRMLHERMGQAVKNDPFTLGSYAKRYGFYGAHPPSDQRFDYIKHYRERTMEAYDEAGNKIAMPVLGGGSMLPESRYQNTPDGDPNKIVYGNPATNRGSDQEPRNSRLPDPPRLRDGSIDYDELNRRNGHVTATGRRNIMGKIA